MTQRAKPHHFNQSLDRGLRILDLYNRQIESLSAKEIADLLGIGATTLYPFLHTLVDHGYLEADANKRYRLGLKLLERVGEIERVYDVRSVARPRLVSLSRTVEANARLAVLYGNEVLYLEQEEGGPAANIILREVVGLRVPAYCTALGKVLLAYLPDEDMSRVIGSITFRKMTERTITCPNRLREELLRVRTAGYALENEELQLGGACVAAPIRNSSGKVIAAISTSVIASRAQGEDLVRIAGAVMLTASEISSELGYIANHPEDESEVMHRGSPQMIGRR
jgi:IclR family KDG regulon transcriptional repressor